MGLTEIYAASCRYYYKIVEQIGLSPKLLFNLEDDETRLTGEEDEIWFLSVYIRRVPGNVVIVRWQYFRGIGRISLRLRF